MRSDAQRGGKNNQGRAVACVEQSFFLWYLAFILLLPPVAGSRSQKIKAVAVDHLSRSNGNGRLKNRAVEDEGVKFAVFAAGVGVRGRSPEEGFVQFAAGEAGIESFRIDASGNGAETVLVEVADQFARVAFQMGKIAVMPMRRDFFRVGAEVFEKDVAEGNLSNALVVEEAERLFHRAS